MKLGRTVREAEVVATYLRGELDSSRFGVALATLLAADGRDPSVLARPDLADEADNAYRLDLLERHRGWVSRTGLFGGFPEGVDWFRARFTPGEVLGVLYIDWSWWVALSGGTRRPRDAAERIRRGEEGEGRGEGYEPLAARLGSDDPPPELIVVTRDHGRFVLVEGHVRMTAYALFPDYLPAELEVLLGVSPRIDEWCMY
jgi:hypothetical protein